MQKPFILAIAGGSASGKSTLVSSLQLQLPQPSTHLPIDRYYFDLSHLTAEERAKTNFDIPEALDIDLFVNHLTELSHGKRVSAPVYDFATHTRQGYEMISPNPIILTDGILLLAIDTIRQAIDYSVFLDVPEDVRLQRKIHRDVSERDRTEAYARKQFDKTVKPVHDELVVPSMRHADLVLDGRKTTTELTEQLRAHVAAALADNSSSNDETDSICF